MLFTSYLWYKTLLCTLVRQAISQNIENLMMVVKKNNYMIIPTIVFHSSLLEYSQVLWFSQWRRIPVSLSPTPSSLQHHSFSRPLVIIFLTSLINLHFWNEVRNSQGYFVRLNHIVLFIFSLMALWKKKKRRWKSINSYF